MSATWQHPTPRGRETMKTPNHPTTRAALILAINGEHFNLIIEENSTRSFRAIVRRSVDAQGEPIIPPERHTITSSIEPARCTCDGFHQTGQCEHLDALRVAVIIPDLD
jgi:hypothetical protein